MSSDDHRRAGESSVIHCVSIACDFQSDRKGWPLMPNRAKRDVDLSTATARRRLAPRPNGLPHWRFISEGRYVGYRRHQGNPDAGRLGARLYLGAERYQEHSIGTADDRMPADGETVFDYRQALDVARGWGGGQGPVADGVA